MTKMGCPRAHPTLAFRAKKIPTDKDWPPEFVSTGAGCCGLARSYPKFLDN